MLVLAVVKPLRLLQARTRNFGQLFAGFRLRLNRLRRERAAGAARDLVYFERHGVAFKLPNCLVLSILAEN